MVGFGNVTLGIGVEAFNSLAFQFVSFTIMFFVLESQRDKSLPLFPNYGGYPRGFEV